MTNAEWIDWCVSFWVDKRCFAIDNERALGADVSHVIAPMGWIT